MEKMSINDFIRVRSGNARLIQDLFLHIKVKALYMAMIRMSARRKDTAAEKAYRKAYSDLLNINPKFAEMNVGSLLKCVYESGYCPASNEQMEMLVSLQNVRNRTAIIRSLFIDLLSPYAFRHRYEYSDIMKKMKQIQLRKKSDQ